MVDAAGDDDPVERSFLRPAIVTVAVPGRDRLVLAVALSDQSVVEPARPLGERLDDLDREHFIGQVREIGRLVARSGADLEDLVAELNVDRIGHARDAMRASDRHTIADVEIVPIIGPIEVLPGDEFLARRQ